jgi:hypothetical protein
MVGYRSSLRTYQAWQRAVPLDIPAFLERPQATCVCAKDTRPSYFVTTPFGLTKEVINEE